MLRSANLAASTLNQKLGHIEALYLHTDELGASLDDALSELDFSRIGNILESFFVKLRNAPTANGTTLNRWNTAFHFVRD